MRSAPPAFPFLFSKLLLTALSRVQGIPTLVLLDGKTGELITKDGRNIISSDAAGANFPWKDGAGANKGGCVVA